MIKNSTALILLLSISLFTYAQSGNNCIILIDGKEFANLSQIPKGDLLKLCSMELRDARVKKILKPVSLQWVVSIAGQIIKGDLTTCTKLTEAINRMQKDDVLFIDEIKYKGVAGLCQGQFALKLE